ncbi:MAG: type II toxin-antitoxin system VapC family toxin [Spirochaetales bacterium]|nr:type II toxin-antitoxin system VapC family toxin [Spirochaetales bacterium]
MAITYLLDTSVYSQPIKRDPLHSVMVKWEKAGDQSMCSSIICEMEVLQGLELKDSDRLWDAYKVILKDRLPLINLDMSVVALYAELQADSRKKGNQRPAFDLLIACTAITHNLVLATCNYKDFKDIKGLKVEDWSS